MTFKSRFPSIFHFSSYAHQWQLSISTIILHFEQSLPIPFFEVSRLYHFCLQKKWDKLPLQAISLYSWDWSYVFYDWMATRSQNEPKGLYATEIKWLFLTLDNSVEQTYVIFKEKTLTNSIYIYVRIINLNYRRIFRKNSNHE